METYLEVSIVCMVIYKKYEFQLLGFETLQEYIDNYSYLIFCLVYVPLPFIMIVYIILNKTQIKKEIFWMDIVKTSTIKVSEKDQKEMFPILHRYGSLFE